MNRNMKMTLLGAAVGYVLSEYLTLRRAAKSITTAKKSHKKDHSYLWAVNMVLKEVQRGKYNNSTTREEVMQRMDADFEYYQSIANGLGTQG